MAAEKPTKTPYNERFKSGFEPFGCDTFSFNEIKVKIIEAILVPCHSLWHLTHNDNEGNEVTIQILNQKGPIMGQNKTIKILTITKQNQKDSWTFSPLLETQLLQ